MLLTYYTLRALAAEWDTQIADATVRAAYSQRKGELSLALGHSESAPSTIVVVARSDRRLLFRNPGEGRRRRNTVSIFEKIRGWSVRGVRCAERDRVLFIDLERDHLLQIALFGPRPNVWLVDGQSNVVVDSFLAPARWLGAPPPATRPAPDLRRFEDFAARLPESGSPVRALSRAVPLFDASLAQETLHRAGVRVSEVAALSVSERRKLYEEALSLEAEIAGGAPRIYWRGNRPEALSLVRFFHLEEAGCTDETFAAVDEAVAEFSRRTLKYERFDRQYIPLETSLRRATERLERSAERMLAELQAPSRADDYERFGHLLMALAADIGTGHEGLSLPDITRDGAPLDIPLDPSLTAIENAQRYYERARRGRAARAHAEERWEQVQQRAQRARERLEALGRVTTLKGLDAFATEHREELDEILGQDADSGARKPFRRYPLPSGFEAWVGKNARANAELTTRYARPHDLWLHARGVPGSHVVIRRPARTTDVPKPVIEAAARLAAYFSRARTSALVPVQVTERKYLRPLKGAPPGTMRVEREDVVLVAPAAPR